MPRNRGPNTTLLSSMTLSGMGPSLAIEGATTAGVFEAYVERVLAPNLRPAQVVVTDNFSAHKTERVRELVDQRGCELLYLPPYSPDLNPIEEAFLKIKGLLRKAEARNRETLVEVMGQVLSSTGSITMISAVGNGRPFTMLTTVDCGACLRVGSVVLLVS